MASFRDLDLPPELLRALEALNFSEPTQIQQKAVPPALAGRDIIASAETGSGKTFAFAIPLIKTLLEDDSARALVLAPTRELAGQIVRSIEDLTTQSKRLSVGLFIGGVSYYPQERAIKRIPRVIVATPGRLVDLMDDHPQMLTGVRFLVLDEADRMLDLGFRPQLRTVRAALPEKRQTLFFSATYPTDIAELAKEWVQDAERITIGSVAKPVEKVDQKLIELQPNEKDSTILRELQTRTGSVLVFARTKKRTDRLAYYLREKGMLVCRIHGDRSQSQREDALAGFRGGKYRVLVATDIAARGIDVPHIEHVINYDLPLAAGDYLHRIGRTARAGRSGSALCLMAPEERKLWKAIERLIGSKNGLHSSEQQRGRLDRVPEQRGSRPQGGPRRRVESRPGEPNFNREGAHERRSNFSRDGRPSAGGRSGNDGGSRRPGSAGQGGGSRRFGQPSNRGAGQRSGPRGQSSFGS